MQSLPLLGEFEEQKLSRVRDTSFFISQDKKEETDDSEACCEVEGRCENSSLTVLIRLDSHKHTYKYSTCPFKNSLFSGNIEKLSSRCCMIIPGLAFGFITLRRFFAGLAMNQTLELATKSRYFTPRTKKKNWQPTQYFPPRTNKLATMNE